MKKKRKLKWFVYPTILLFSIFILPLTLSKFSNSYSNDQINLTITKPVYTIKFDSNGGTGSMNDMANIVYGSTRYLPNNAFTRTNYFFDGWNTERDGSGTSYSNGQQIKNLTTVNNDEITLFAQWYDKSYLDNLTFEEDFTCTQEVRTFTAPITGRYLLEAWGAQGGDASEVSAADKVMPAVPGGRGGYSYGIVTLNEGDEVYVVVGCQGETIDDISNGKVKLGGYNGGGNAILDITLNSQGSGGGATHFAVNKNLGELRKYSSTANQNNILLVAGGGGGSYNSAYIFYYSTGGAGGGENGGPAVIYYNTDYVSTPIEVNGFTYSQGLEVPGGSQSQQTSPSPFRFGTFGLGVSANYDSTGTDAGAGGGWYGGSKLRKSSGNGGMAGSGGSGHVNNNIINIGETLAGSSMIPTHDGSSTMLGNSGDGYAKISLINPHYKVKFDANGGTGTMSDMDFVYGTAQNLTANTFTRSEHEFIGWNTKADGTGTSYANNVSVNNLSTTDGDEITLYAQWRNRLIYFQMPPDWYGTNVCAKLYTQTQANDPDCLASDAMTLVDNDKKIYKFDTSSYSNIDDYTIVYFSNGITIEDASGKTPRRAIAQNFQDTSGKAKLEQIFVPELYNESGKTRVYGYATNFYFYLWKGDNNNGWPGSSGTVIGQRIHKLEFNTADYENMIVDQGSGQNQSENLTTPQYQDITYKLTSTQISGRKFVHLAFRLFYEGSWHNYDNWINSEYNTWYSNDYADFQAAKTNLNY